MKITFNLTTNIEDLKRFPTQADLLKHMEKFDGVELMYLGEDVDNKIPTERVIGLHMGYFPYWYDFWRGDQEAVLKEFGSQEVADLYYGGKTRDVITDSLRKDLENAHRYGAEYVVLHTTEATIEETFTWNYRHTDEEIIDGLCEIINEVFADEDGSILLLLENLWQPGMTFTRPEMTARLLNGVKYPNKGIMLDTGHLMHTNLYLKTQEEAVDYIHRMLDEHGPLCKYIRGVHLNQSLTGEYCLKTKANPPAMEEDYFKRCGQMYMNAFAVDKHQPFTGKGVKELIERIAPDYVTFEFITESLEQHQEYLAQQLEALGR